MADETDNTDNTGAEGSEAFIGSLGETNKSNELFTGMENAEQLGQTYLDLHKSHEEAKASLPVVPENVADYKFEAVEGAEVDEAAVVDFRVQAKELKLDAAQFAGVMAFDLARNKKAMDAAKEAKDAAIVANKTAMGDAYEGNVVLAGKVLKAFGAEGLAKTDLGNNPELFQLLVKVGKAVSEDSLTGSGPTDGDGGEKDPADVMFGDVVKKP